MYDIIVIGGGPAGMSAAIYARRSGRSVLVIERAAFGGQMATSPRVENYPGFSSVSGAEHGGGGYAVCADGVNPAGELFRPDGLHNHGPQLSALPVNDGDCFHAALPFGFFVGNLRISRVPRLGAV